MNLNIPFWRKSMINNSPHFTPSKKFRLSPFPTWKSLRIILISTFISVPLPALAHPLNFYPTTEIAQVFFPNSARCKIDDPETTLINQSQAIIGDKVTGFYLQYLQKCPSQSQVEELRYFWTKNQEYWHSNPQAIQHFFQSNFHQDRLGNQRKLIGESIEKVQQTFIHSAIKVESPQIIKDMTWYIFRGENISYEIVVRDNKVSRIYLID